MKLTRVQVLLHELCLELGCCVSPQAAARLVEHPPADVDAFTTAVLEGEGVDPEESRRVWRQVRAKVSVHFRKWEEEDGRQELFDELTRYPPTDGKA